MSVLFDPWEYYEELKSANVPDDLARLQSTALQNCMRAMEEQYNDTVATKSDIEAQNARAREIELRLQKEIREAELNLQKEMKEVELRLQKEMKEVELRLQKEIREVEARLQEGVQKAHQEIKEVELRLQKEMKEVELRLQKEIREVDLRVQKVKYDLLKWQIGIAVTILVVMAKGFGWLGF